MEVDELLLYLKENGADLTRQHYKRESINLTQSGE